MTYILGNVYDINLPTSWMLLTHTGKNFSHEQEDYRTSCVLPHSSMEEEYSVVKE